MTYPVSFRRKVVARIEEGMGKREAARLFKISPNTLYLWLNSPDMEPHNDAPRQRKIDKEKLRAHVDANPDMYLRERAVHLGSGSAHYIKRCGNWDFVKKRAALFRALYYEKRALSTMKSQAFHAF